MAAIEVSKLFERRSGKDTRDNHRTYTRMYEVLTDSDDDDEQVVGNASVGGVAVPLPGDPLDSDPEAVVVDMDFDQSDESPRIWYVTAYYDSNPPTASDRGGDKPDNKVDLDGNTIGKGERQASPLDEPAQWTTTFEDAEEPAVEGVRVDGAGNLVIEVPDNWTHNHAYLLNEYVRNGANVYVCTTAGTSVNTPGAGPGGNGTAIADGTVVWCFYATFAQTQNDPNHAVRTAIRTSGKLPFDPPVMVPVSKIVLSVTKNMPLVTFEDMLALKNAQNVTTWRGVPPRCAKVKSLTHDGGKEKDGVQYVTGKWEIAFDADTHDLRVLDAGYGYLATRTDPVTLTPVTKYMRFTDPTGAPLDHPVPLNGAGQPLGPDDPPVFLRFVPRQTKLLDFNSVLPF